jgi:hypothetical protein
MEEPGQAAINHPGVQAAACFGTTTTQRSWPGAKVLTAFLSSAPVLIHRFPTKSGFASFWFTQKTKSLFSAFFRP